MSFKKMVKQRVKKTVLSLESGFMEDKAFKRCQQIQCSYHIKGGCKPCQECKAPPHILNKSCQRCTNCATVPGELRWNDPKAIKEAQAVKKYNEQMEKEVALEIAKVLASGHSDADSDDDEEEFEWL